MYISDVFVKGAEFPFFRIPAIAALPDGTLVAAAECRMTLSDWDTRAIGIKRSTDGGRSWGEINILDRHDSLPVGNPTFVVSGSRLYILWVTDYVNLYVSYSDDGGVTFSDKETIDISGFKKSVDFTVAAPGPGHGLAYDDGGETKLIVPMWLAYGGGEPGTPRPHHPSVVSAVIYDKSGWHTAAGAVSNLKDPSETCAVQLKDGRVMLDLRNENPEHRRAYAFMNPDTTFTEAELDPNLIDPTCFGSAVRTGDRIILVNCASDAGRVDLSLTVIGEDGKAEPAKQKIYDKAGYADIAPAIDGGVHVFTERDDFEALSCITLTGDEIAI